MLASALRFGKTGRIAGLSRRFVPFILHGAVSGAPASGCFPSLPMLKDNVPTPRAYKGVMVSSTFKDLKEHRAALINIIDRANLKAVAMENDSAKADVDVVDSSLRMVQEAAAYISVIAKKYGQTPKCHTRNPGKVSITELEFDEAVRLGRPILLFIMGDNHPVIESEIELKPANRKKLKAFRDRAKKMGPDTDVHRVYETFESIEDFKEKAAQSVADLRRYLEKEIQDDAGEADEVGDEKKSKNLEPDPIPKAPAFYAEPAYLGSHEFVGRRDQLETLGVARGFASGAAL